MTREEAKRKEVSVWLAAAVDCDTPDSLPTITYSIDEFMNWIINQGSCCATFHNLHGFDRLFIFNWLARNGYRLIPSTDDASNKSHCVVSDKSFTVYTRNENEWIVTNFIDSKIILQGSVKAIGEQIGSYHKGEETPLVLEGQAIEQTKHANSDQYWTMEEAIQYINADVQVIASALKQMGILKIWDSGMRTAASMAYNGMLVGQDIREHPRVQRSNEIKAWHKANDPNKVYEPVKLLTAFKPFGTDKYLDPIINGTAQTRSKVSQNTSIMNHMVKRSYKGGFSYLNPRKEGIDIKDGLVLDINSMYPWIYSTKPLPRYPSGISTKINDNPAVQAAATSMEKFEVYHQLLESKTEEGKWPLIVVNSLKAVCYPDRVPMIKPATTDKTFKHLKVLDDNNRVRSVQDGYSYTIDYPDKDLPLTWPDFDYLVHNYWIDSGSIKTVFFYQEDQELSDKLRHHCDYWIEQKRTTKGPARMFAKMMLNSPYGKLGQHIREYKEHKFTLNNGRLVDMREETDSQLGGKSDADLITASYITAWGRHYLANTINKVGIERFIYCDTDSMHIEGTVSDEDLISWGVDVHDSDLGKWKREKAYDRARYLKAKHYGYGQGEEWQTVASGYTRQINEADFTTGAIIHDLRPISVKGGTLLLPVAMELRPAWQDKVPDQSCIGDPAWFQRF